MSDKTKIEWTDATVNAWIGCTNVSPGCDHCYAERLARRFGVRWGADATRRQTKGWRETLERLNRKGRREGRFLKVFPNSMSDVFDTAIPTAWRQELLEAPERYSNLLFQFLTKRVGNVARMVPREWMDGHWPGNAWLGATLVNQPEVDRDGRKLIRLPAPVTFGSFEPLLGAVDASAILRPYCDNGSVSAADGGGKTCPRCDGHGGCQGLSWVIAGGESGPGARPMHPDWARSLRDQCAAANVPFFFKQWGEWAVASAENGEFDCDMQRNNAHWVHHDGVMTKPSHFRTDPAAAQVKVEPYAMRRFGKKAAGRQLDGIEHSAFPDSRL